MGPLLAEASLYSTYICCNGGEEAHTVRDSESRRDRGYKSASRGNLGPIQMVLPWHMGRGQMARLRDDYLHTKVTGAQVSEDFIL